MFSWLDMPPEFWIWFFLLPTVYKRTNYLTWSCKNVPIFIHFTRLEKVGLNKVEWGSTLLLYTFGRNRPLCLCRTTQHRKALYINQALSEIRTHDFQDYALLHLSAVHNSNVRQIDMCSSVIRFRRTNFVGALSNIVTSVLVKIM
jgi:hypothetical protein